MRAGEDVKLVSRCFERRAEEGDGRTLAVGPGHVQHRRQAILRPAEAIEKIANALQTEPIPGGR